MADEAGFLELLIANERIGRALDILCDPYQRSKYVELMAVLCCCHAPLIAFQVVAQQYSSSCCNWQQ